MGRKSNVAAPTLIIEQDSHATSPSTTPMRPTPLIGSWGDYEWGADYKAAVLAVAAEKVATAAPMFEPVATHMIPAYEDDCYAAYTTAATAPAGFDAQEDDDEIVEGEEQQAQPEDDGSVTPLPHAHTDAFDTSFQHASVVEMHHCHMSSHSLGEYEQGWYSPEASYLSQTQSYSEQLAASYGAPYGNHVAVTHTPYGLAPAVTAPEARSATVTPYLSPPQMPHRATPAQPSQPSQPTPVQSLRSYVPQQRAQLEYVAAAPVHHHHQQQQQQRHSSFHSQPRATAAAAQGVPHATNYHNRRTIAAPASGDTSTATSPVPPRVATGPHLSFAPTQPGEISKFAPPPPPGPETDATFTRNGSPDDAFYMITMRWYERAVISQTANGFPPCPPAEQYLHDFPGWLDEVSKWWKTNFANRKGRPRGGNGSMNGHGHHHSH